MSLAFSRLLWQSERYPKAALSHACASLVLLRGSASVEREMQCWELANVSMQVVAATVRLRVSAEESRMHFAMDCTEVRLSEKRAMVDWRSGRGVGLGGSWLWDWEREVWHC